MEKLTLSVDPHVISIAKAYAEARGTSVSRLVENLLRMVAAPGAGGPSATAVATPPILGRLRGSLKRGSLLDYHRHLERKYR